MCVFLENKGLFFLCLFCFFLFFVYKRSRVHFEVVPKFYFLGVGGVVAPVVFYVVLHSSAYFLQQCDCSVENKLIFSLLLVVIVELFVLLFISVWFCCERRIYSLDRMFFSDFIIELICSIVCFWVSIGKLSNWLFYVGNHKPIELFFSSFVYFSYGFLFFVLFLINCAFLMRRLSLNECLHG